MPATRLTMRKIREVLRLKFDCRLTKRQIAKSCAIARSTVKEIKWSYKSELKRSPCTGGFV